MPCQPLAATTEQTTKPMLVTMLSTPEQEPETLVIRVKKLATVRAEPARAMMIDINTNTFLKSYFAGLAVISLYMPQVLNVCSARLS